MFQVTLFGIAGPFLNLYNTLDIDNTLNSQQLCWALGLEELGEIGADLQWPEKLSSGTITLYNDEFSLLKGCSEFEINLQHMDML